MPNLSGLAAVALIMGVAGWLVFVRIWPEKMCRWCGGAGKVKAGKKRRTCWRCHGDGYVPRLGSKLLRRGQ